MRLLFWRKVAQREALPVPAPRRWTWLAGRRMLTRTPYVLPKDQAEGDRLDIQHHLIKLALGSNYCAPLRQPTRILDVACGTGTWGREMAHHFTEARVLGIDVDRTPLERALERLGPQGLVPPNFRFQVADALQPLPFAEAAFDYVHARLMSPFVPERQWPQVVGELLRVLEPGGYLELVEFEESARSTDPALTALIAALDRLALARGLDTHTGGKLGAYLHQAGATAVQQRRIVLGAGRQAQRQQRLLAADALALVKHVGPLLIRAGAFTETDYQALLRQAEEAAPQAVIQFPLIVAVGQKR